MVYLSATLIYINPHLCIYSTLFQKVCYIICDRFILVCPPHFIFYSARACIYSIYGIVTAAGFCPQCMVGTDHCSSINDHHLLSATTSYSNSTASQLTVLSMRINCAESAVVYCLLSKNHGLDNIRLYIMSILNYFSTATSTRSSPKDLDLELQRVVLVRGYARPLMMIPVLYWQ